MPDAAPRLCLHPGCGARTLKAFCDTHRPAAWLGARQRTTPQRRVYSSAGWRRRRARQLARDPDCSYCGAPATEVDHIEPDGPDMPGNLQSLCRACHSRKTARESNVKIAERRLRSGRRSSEPWLRLHGEIIDD